MEKEHRIVEASYNNSKPFFYIEFKTERFWGTSIWEEERDYHNRRYVLITFKTLEEAKEYLKPKSLIVKKYHY